MSDMREQFEAAQAADLAIRNRAAARPDGTQFETRAPKERVEAPKAARLNLSLAMDDSNPTAQRMAQERAAEQVEAIARKAAAEVMMQMFPGLYDEHTPQVVRELQHNVFAGPLPKVFTMDEHMCYWGDGGNITQAFSLFPQRLSDHLFVCSGGMWFHKTAWYEFSEQHFWTGAFNECPDGAIWISNNILPVCVYIEAPSKTWGYTTNFNSELVGGTTYLRRSIFSIEFTVDGTPTNMITRNVGDIYS